MLDDATLIDHLDPDLQDRLGSRRDLFRGAALKLGAVASAPVLLAVASKEAFAQVPAQVADILNFALTLEYLEDEFYRTGLSEGVVPQRFGAVFTQISKHETAHVGLLRGVLGGAAVAKPRFDFTAGGRYGRVFRDFATFSLLSQTFEDTGVAAYKGQAPALTGGGDLLTTALRIHSVEARHAAEVRRVRGVKAWTGPFDKPLSMAQVLHAVQPFVAG